MSKITGRREDPSWMACATSEEFIVLMFENILEICGQLRDNGVHA